MVESPGESGFYPVLFHLNLSVVRWVWAQAKFASLQRRAPLRYLAPLAGFQQVWNPSGAFPRFLRVAAAAAANRLLATVPG